MVISTTGHENHCLLIACNFAMIAKCLESFTRVLAFTKVLALPGTKIQNWCVSSPHMILADPTRWDPTISRFGFGKNLFAGYSGL